VRPYAARDPIKTARVEAPIEAITLFDNRLRNSSRTVEISKIVLGDRPSERNPIHLGSKSTQGIKWPWVTLTAALKVVVIVQ